MRFQLATFVVFSVLLCDQLLKFWVKTNMYLGQEYVIFSDWFKIHFTENPGMAFGIELGGENGKLFLTLFRLVAVTFITGYLINLILKHAPKGLIISLSLILAGALGNIIDSVFYGVIFDDSYHQVASFLPETGGYGSLMQGKVVDMLYFPLIDTHLPSWVPFWGADHPQCDYPFCDGRFVFFRPVFNIADSAITSGVFLILIFQKRYFKGL